MRLPYVLWCLREKPSTTTRVSPYTLVYGTLPRGPLAVLKDSWGRENGRTFHLGKNMGAYLINLRENLIVAKRYADLVADREQERYAKQYNLRSTDRAY